MEKISFESIGKAMEVFDTDKINIGRRAPIQNPDGTMGESNPETPLYTDIPCHISFIKADNPDNETVDTKPIITGLKINCNLSVDLQQGDYITAFKCSSTGEILETYKGVIGFPTVTQSRKSAEMEMRTDI